MAKIKISFNNTNYSIDESAISSASDSLKSHLSTTMSGSGATINFGGTSYNVDSAKLLAATNDFVSHLGIVAGNGYKVIVNGTEYSVGSDKVAGAVSELEIVLDGLKSVDGDTLTWDGSTEGRVTSSNGIYYKISDAILTEEDLSNGVIKTSNSGETTTHAFSDVIIANGAWMFDNFQPVAFVPESAICDFWPEAGVYFVSFRGRFTASLTVPGYTGFGSQSEDEGGSGESDYPAAGLYETGAIALYNEQGAEAVKNMLITPWDEMVSSEAIVIDNGAMSIGVTLPDSLPEKNEYGFYYDTSYSDGRNDFVFHEDTSFDVYEGGSIIDSISAGKITYTNDGINMSNFNMGIGIISCNGYKIDFGSGHIMSLGNEVPISDDLVLPNDGTITTITNYNFNRQPITGLLLPDSVTTIGENAFENCTGLTNIEISDSVTTIGKNAFENCIGLTNIEIPDSVTTIGEKAFEYCTSLTGVYIHDLDAWCEIEFENNSSHPLFWGKLLYLNGELVTDIIIKNARNYTFAGCASLVSATIADGVDSIGNFIFQNCTNMTSINIPISVVNIENGALYNCAKLTNINYAGTMAQWNAIEKKVSKHEKWNYKVPATEVVCSDGTVAL